MANDKIFELIESFVTLAQQEPINEKYQAQREMLTKFFEHFYSNLRAIITELGGDILVLKDQKFDQKMQKMLHKLHHDLVEIIKDIKEDKPYLAAEKLVKYVLDKPNSSIISNLDFLAKHHIKATSADFPVSSTFKHSQIRSLDKLTNLAEHLKKFMAEHPLLTPPNTTTILRLDDTLKEIPSFTAGPDELTRR